MSWVEPLASPCAGVGTCHRYPGTTLKTSLRGDLFSLKNYLPHKNFKKTSFTTLMFQTPGMQTQSWASLCRVPRRVPEVWGLGPALGSQQGLLLGVRHSQECRRAEGPDGPPWMAVGLTS